MPAYLTPFLPTVPTFQDRGGKGSGMQQAAWQQQHAQDFAPAIAQALAKGDYSNAWRVASMDPYATQYLTNPQYLSQLNGGRAFTPAQSTAFYTAAMPFSQTLAANGGVGAVTGYNFNASGDQFSSGNNIYNRLQQLAANPGSGAPDVSGIAGSSTDKSFLGKNMPYLMAAAAGAMSGGAGLAAGAGAWGAGAISGAVQSGVLSSEQGTPITLGSIGKSAATGALSGGLTQGLNGLKYGLTDVYGVPVPVASGITGGLAGAAVGGVGAALNGGNVGRGALVGGASGAASSAVQSGVNQVTGGPGILGNVAGRLAGTYAGSLASKYSAPAAPAATPAPAPAAASGAPSMSTAQMPQLPAAPASGPTNIGSYSGYGYAPQQLNSNPVSDYSTYGQGPEASFFTPGPQSQSNPMQQPGSPQQPLPGPASTLPPMPPVMRGINQGTITRANST